MSQREAVMMYFEGVDVPSCWLDEAVCMSRVPCCGKMPGDEGYQERIDIEWAAGIIARKVAKRSRVSNQGVMMFTSEGTTIQVDHTYWDKLADDFFNDSQIIGPATKTNSHVNWVDAGVHSAPFRPRSRVGHWPRRWSEPWTRRG